MFYAWLCFIHQFISDQRGILFAPGEINFIRLKTTYKFLQDKERNGENISEKTKESMLATTSDKNSCNIFVKKQNKKLLLILI